jgi:hypothetical protein
MAVEGDGPGRRIAFRTNVDDLVPVDADHALRFAQDAGGGLRPYVHVRRDLWALLTRALTFDLLALAEEQDGWLGVMAGGTFHRVAPADSA